MSLIARRWVASAQKKKKKRVGGKSGSADANSGRESGQGTDEEYSQCGRKVALRAMGKMPIKVRAKWHGAHSKVTCNRMSAAKMNLEMQPEPEAAGTAEGSNSSRCEDTSTELESEPDATDESGTGVGADAEIGAGAGPVSTDCRSANQRFKKKTARTKFQVRAPNLVTQMNL